MLQDIDHLAPIDGEAAVLSFVAARDGPAWRVVCGSLLSVKQSVARTSWPRWREIQPAAGPRYDSGGFDLGPQFWAEPFSGLRIVRTPVNAPRWADVVSGIEAGIVETPFAPCEIAMTTRSSTVFLGQRGTTDAHKVVTAVCRPLTAVVARLDAPPVPATGDTWAWQVPPHLRPGPDLGAISPHRRLLHWPIALLGIDWLGHPDHPPVTSFVIGRAISDAWIARVRPDYHAGHLVTTIVWDEQRLDPLGCTLLVRNEIDGLPALTRHVRISDLPSNHKFGSPEPRQLGWSDRTLDVTMPHGPRRSAWGVALMSAEGRLLDERPAVPRFESVSLSISVGDPGAPSHAFTVGDRGGPPSASDRDAAVSVAEELDQEARAAAADRRMSTSGDLKQYLQFRFSCRAGELLICDPWLLGSEYKDALAVLQGLGRPMRGLSGGIPEAARPHLRSLGQIEVRQLPNGRRSLHDRVWIVGETGLLVGTSLNDLVRAGGSVSATTVTELPYADAAAWRTQFEAWWSATKPLKPGVSQKAGSGT